MNFKYDAILSLIDMQQNPTGTITAYGIIRDDRKARFEDCTPITTSYIVSVEKVDGEWYAKTRNSVYKLEGFV